MKKLVLILTLVICIQGFEARTQEWAPDGAEWYYEYVNFYYQGYVHVTVLGDTVINDTACRILNRFSVIHNLEFGTTSHYDHGDVYMFGDESKVYLFENGKFYLVYDFTATPGDSLIIPHNSNLSFLGCNPEGMIAVTDTGTININDHDLKRIFVEPLEESHWALDGNIVPTIGPLDNYMLPEPYWCAMDANEGGRLRCYSDPEFGLYSTGIAPECDYLVSLPELNEHGVEVYPNPANGIIHINIPGNRSSELTVYNSSGMKILSRLLTQSENNFDVSDLKPGLYFARIKSDDGYINRLIVIQ